MAKRELATCCRCHIGQAANVKDGGICPFVPRDTAAGETIFDEGAPAERVWFVKQGAVIVSRSCCDDGSDEDGRKIEVEGAVLGVEALFRDTYLDSARALTRVTLCSASRDVVNGWLDLAVR
jgi:CRP-like cAMP-binding protein